MIYNITLFIRYHYEDDRQHLNTTKLAIISIRHTTHNQDHGYVFDTHKVSCYYCLLTRELERLRKSGVFKHVFL